MKRFERYVLSEVVPLLLAAVSALLVLLTLKALETVLAPLLAKGAAPLLVARLLALNVPEALALALPLALMFATLLGLSRLSADSEIKAALASGVPGTRLFQPVLLLGTVTMLLAFAINEVLVTRARVESRTVQREIVMDNPRVLGLDRSASQGLVLRDALNRAISVGSIGPGGELLNLRIVTMQPGLPPREVITAKSGTLMAGSNVLELRGGQRISYQDARPVTVLTFERGTLPVQDVQANFAGGKEKNESFYLPLPELLARVGSYQQSGLKAPGDYTALYRKFAEPLAALALSFFAVCLALFTFRSGHNLGLVWALLLSFAYYATWSVFKVMGENGAVPPLLAAFGADLIAVLAGLALLWLAGRR
ncbi:LptF/LptG family permease [Deinococcus lacus]|uniref:LptF/LptG family permease n=1 Tax=Deinococcus lacus TaxID=392561 RepID=A0ABW1YER5_9DEIO